ncbi:MAG: cytidylyltransferase domain-containing protein, partial [Candidatus Kapaibacteriota bacterium]
MSDAVLAVIPARYASTRLPGKPLVDLAGKPMIQWVWQAVAASTKVHRVVVATDDERIATVVGGFGGEVVMTDPELPSGTDRCAAAARSIGWESAGYVLNIQGDEPLLPTSLVDDLVDAVVIGGADVVTPICRLTNPADLAEPSIVTVAPPCIRHAPTH